MEATPTRLDPSTTEPSWRRAIRWFAAEFLVVVSGILVAMALQAWWNDRGNRAEERVLLQRMLSDLTSDSIRLSAELRADSASIAQVAFVKRYMDQESMFADSVADEFGGLGMASAVSLQAAQYETLKSKGLGLITDPALRSAITSFYEVTQASLDLHNEWVTTAEARWMPIILRRFNMVIKPGTPNPQNAYARNYSALRNDAEFRLFLDEYAYYMSYAAPWKGNAVSKAGTLMAKIRAQLDSR